MTTNNDTGVIAIRDNEYSSAPLWLLAPGTVLAGTLLARPSDLPVVDAEVTVAADGGNAGDGTVTAIVLDTDVVVGVYTLNCTGAVANGGVFEVLDPDDVVVEEGLTLTPGALGVTVLRAGPLLLTITDGAADFEVDDTWTLTTDVTTGANTDGALAPFDPDGSDDFEFPKFVLTYDVILTTENVVTVTADGGNTGDGTLDATIVDDAEVELGPYTLTCNTAVANGGVFTLLDPYGVEIADDITLTVLDLGTTVVVEGGFRLAITDGATSFAEDDFFTIDVREFVATKGVRALNSGEVNAARLLIHVDGDDSNIDAPVIDQLRDYGITPIPVSQLSALDNQ
jgi:hypothetical protein